MSQSTLLLRCKQTIQDLNSIIRSNQHQLSQLQSTNKKLLFDLGQKQSLRLSMLEQMNKLKRGIVQQRMLFENKLNQERLLTLQGKKLLDEQEVKYCELIQCLQRVEQENGMLQERVEGNKRVVREWEQAIEEVTGRMRGQQAEKEVMERERGLLRGQVEELKRECERNYVRGKEWEEVARRRENIEAELGQTKGDVRKMAAELIEREKMYKALEDQNKRLIDLLQQQKHTMGRLEEHLKLLEEQGKFTNSQSLSRFASHSSKQQPKPLNSLKQSSQRFRSNTNLSSDGKNAFIQKPSKELIPPYPHQSQPASLATSQIRKKLQFTMGSKQKSQKRRSKQRTLDKLSRLEQKVKGIMHELRQ